MKITEASIDNRTSVFILALLIVIYGVVSYIQLPRESYPDISIPLVIVSTPYFGVSPEDIESLITQPIEKEINAISDVKKITSSSMEGYSLIQAEFESGYDIDDAVQKVRDKVTKAEAELPDEVDKPDIVEINFSEFPIMTFNLSGPQGLVQLKDIADDMKDNIENIDGVLKVEISGGLEREVQVNVDASKLQHYGLIFDDVINAVSSENRTIPGGLIDVNGSSFLVRIPGEFDEPYIIQDLVVEVKNGKPIYINDVAEVDYSFKDRQTYSRLNGRECVTVNVSKRTGANIIDIADQVHTVISEYTSKLPVNIDIGLTVDQSEDIDRSVKNLENNIFSGLVLVLIVLFSLLGMRNAVFVALAIPLSMLLSFIVISAVGLTLNFVVLFALILALGMLVDNAIVVIENIYKFLEEGENLIDAAKKGTAEVAWPITTSTLTTVTAFFPILFMPGIVGDFFFFIPAVVIITLLSSLFVALIINPVIAAVFMKLETGEQNNRGWRILIAPLKKISRYATQKALPVTLSRYENILITAIGPERAKGQKIHWRNLSSLILIPFWFIFTITFFVIPAIPNEWLLAVSTLMGIGIIFFLTSPKLRVISGSFLMLITIILLFAEFDLGTEFFPSVDPERIYVNVESPVGTNIDKMNEIVYEIEERLNPYLGNEVEEIVASVGSSNNPFDAGGNTPNKSTITVEFIDYNDRAESSRITTDRIRNDLQNIAGADIEVAEEEGGPPVGKPVNIEIQGDDLTILGDLTEKVKELTKTVPGVVDLTDNYDSGRPELRITIDRERAAFLSMNTSLIANQIRTAVNGFEASKYRIQEEEYDITVRLKENQRSSVNEVRNLRIPFRKDGQTYLVPLLSVADVRYDKGPGTIRRKDLERVITVQSNVAEGYNENAVLAEVRAKLTEIELPPDYSIAFTGAQDEQKETSEFLGKALLIALMGISLILVIQFNSILQPMIIMFAVIISLIGVFIGLVVYQLPFGIAMTGIGVISLAGVVVNNNIVLIDYVNILRKRGYTNRDSVIQAGLRRFRPVTLTAITTILGLIPLTFGFGFDIYTFGFTTGGAEADFWRSMGIAVIFGLAFATILTLIIVPVIFMTIYDLREAVSATFFSRNKK